MSTTHQAAPAGFASSMHISASDDPYGHIVPLSAAARYRAELLGLAFGFLALGAATVLALLVASAVFHSGRVS